MTCARYSTPGRLGDAQDSDGDGLPDWWELAYGTNWKVADATDDPDHDGLSNLQEYFAGTDPHDANSTLKLRADALPPNFVSLQFSASSNHTYSILYKDNLNNVSWTKLADIGSRPTNWLSILPDTVTPATNRFYRLVTPSM